MIHSLIMRHLDRSRVDVHVACNAGDGQGKSAALKALETIPNLHVRPTVRPHRHRARSKAEVARDLLDGPAALASLGGLIAYARRTRFDIVYGTEKPRDAFYGLLLARAIAPARSRTCTSRSKTQCQPFVRWAMKHDDGLIAVSDFVAQSAVKKVNRPRSRTTC